jgi:beta-glucosidase
MRRLAKPIKSTFMINSFISLRRQPRPESISWRTLKNTIYRICFLTFFGLLFAVSVPADDAIKIIGAVDPAALNAPEVAGPEIWKDPMQPVDARVQDLVHRMSLAEKVSQLLADAAAIPRLGLPAYSYRNECNHGVQAKQGFSTVFPQSIGMAATWDTPLIRQEADVIATEARAHFNNYIHTHEGNSVMHEGISFYAPNINIVRDPRWGRGQETYGEDPFLTAQFGVAFIRGLQGDDPKYVKTLACAKHYAVHSGPERLRHQFNAAPSETDLYDTYLPAFEAAVREGHVGSVMGAYSSLYGIPDCAAPFLLTQLLHRWGFDGFVVSDGGAIADIYLHHKFASSSEAAAATAVKAGCDLFSGSITAGPPGHYPQLDYEVLGRLIQEHLLTEQQIDAALTQTLAARFRLGLFDPPAMVPWSGITMAQNDTPQNRALALKVAEESIVLLKNNGLLPLDRAKIKRIAVIGSNADSARMLMGNYEGRPSKSVTILEGIRQLAGTNIDVSYSPGCPLALKINGSNRPTSEMEANSVSAAKSADVVIYVGGLDSTLETEEQRETCQDFDFGDRTRIELPPVQEALIKKLHATDKPVVFINCSGSAIAMPWEKDHLPAIIQAWYPGEEGGRAVAEVLFGDVDPAGRLPITFYTSTKDLPPFEDYSMSNRTYRYFNDKPEFAFGHGLSYTKYTYDGGKLNHKVFTPDDILKVSFIVKNSGGRDGDEVAQMYFRHVHSAVPQPDLALCGFTRLHLSRGQATQATIEVPAKCFRYWDTNMKQYVVEPGAYQLLVGAASDEIRFNLPFTIAATQ